MTLSEMTVLVTGAANGIGRALAEGFLAEGAAVVGVDIDERGLASLAAAGAFTLNADVGEEDAVHAAIKAAVARHGRLDVLVNNAGLGLTGTIEDARAGDFELMFQVMVMGPIYGMRHALPTMRRQGFGRIVNLLSRSAEKRLPEHGAYNGAKAALWAITRTVAAEAKGSGVLVNGLIPGPVRTAMNPTGSQTPDAAWRTARMLALLPPDGPSGQVFWNEREYVLFSEGNEAYAV